MIVIEIVVWLALLSFFLKAIIQYSIDKSENFSFLVFNSIKYLLPLKRSDYPDASKKIISFLNFLIKVFYFSFMTMTILVIIEFSRKS